MALKLAHRRCADLAETPPDSAQGEMETILDFGDVGRQGQARDLDGERRDVPMGIEWVRCSRNKPSRSLASLGPLAYKVDLGAPVFTLSSPRRVYTYHRAPPALPSPSSSQLPLPSALSPRHAPPQSRPPTFFGPSCRSPFTRSARHAFPNPKVRFFRFLHKVHPSITTYCSPESFLLPILTTPSKEHRRPLPTPNNARTAQCRKSSKGTTFSPLHDPSK